MTDAQLAVLLAGLLSELDDALAATREAMPEGAEREQFTEWQRKPEHVGKIVIWPSEETHDLVTRDGDYLALVPLVALRAAWQERFDTLKTQGATE